MAEKKSLKTALILSILMLLICVASMVGATMAWFTDYTSSDLNTIQVGTLDVELEYSYDGEDWKDVREYTHMFDKNASWLPGHSEHVYLRIKNEGSLALKYQLSMNILREQSSINMLGRNYKLSEYLKVGALSNKALFGTDLYIEGTSVLQVNAGDKALIRNTATNAFTEHVNLLTTADPTLVEGYLSPGESQVVALMVRMPETPDQEINYPETVNGPKLIFGIDVIAGQQMEESDSFGDDYDAGATYPLIGSPELLEKLERAGGIS